MKNTSVRAIWYPIADSTASRLVAESPYPFSITVIYGAGKVEHVRSLSDGMTHRVVVDVVPATAYVYGEDFCITDTFGLSGRMSVMFRCFRVSRETGVQA